MKICTLNKIAACGTDRLGAAYTITDQMAEAAGVPEPLLVHVTSDAIAAHDPRRGPGLLGDKAHSVIFDNSKIKALVPGFSARIPFAEGAAEIPAWFDAHPGEQQVDRDYMDLSDLLAGAAS